MDHDRLFKQLLSEFFADFLRLFVPDLATRLDHTELVPLDKELLGEDPPAKRHEVDLLVRARMRDEPAAFLIHVEAQAQHQPDFARRMFRYFTRLHEAHGKPVYPIAVLAHRSPRRAAPGVYEVVAGGRVVMRYEFEVVQLNRLQWEDFKDLSNPVAAAFMARMRLTRGEEDRVKWACYAAFARLGLTPDQARILIEFVESYLPLDEAAQQRFDKTLEAAAPSVKEAIMELPNQWIEKGLRKGRQEATLDVLLSLLTRRFGLVPEVTQRALGQLPEARLRAITESIFELKGLDDLDV
jgi:antitoxin component of RelBE/YafQ-DinJ toxin-antitoxin module